MNADAFSVVPDFAAMLDREIAACREEIAAARACIETHTKRREAASSKHKLLTALRPLYEPPVQPCGEPDGYVPDGPRAATAILIDGPKLAAAVTVAGEAAAAMASAVTDAMSTETPPSPPVCAPAPPAAAPPDVMPAAPDEQRLPLWSVERRALLRRDYTRTTMDELLARLNAQRGPEITAKLVEGYARVMHLRPKDETPKPPPTPRSSDGRVYGTPPGAASRPSDADLNATAATYDIVARWAGERGIAFSSWEDLPRVNAKREQLRCPPFKRLFTAR